MSTLPREIKEKLLTTDFLNRLEDFRRKHNVKISVSDKRFVSFIAEYLNIPEEDVRKYASKLVPLVGDILSRRVKLKTEEPSTTVASGEPHIHVNSLANTLYLLLYKLSPATASRTMYNILEKYVVNALSGDESALRVVDVFFSPVSVDNYKTVVEQLKQVLSEHRELCSLGSKELAILCLKSSCLPVTKSMNATSPVDNCVKLVSEAFSKVCHSG